ncbi:MAG: cytochrome c biogenesis protein CcsA [Isosphaeraceae bacterium]
MFDQQYSNWLGLQSPWIAVGPLLAGKPEELERAGIPTDLAEDFLRAYRALEAAQRRAPGELPEPAAVDLLAAAQELGSSLAGYPDPPSMARETRWIRFVPASRARGAFGLALVLLVAGLAAGKARASAWLHSAGLVAMAAGIALGLDDLGTSSRIVRLVPAATPGQEAESAAMVAAALGLSLGIPRRRSMLAIAGGSAAMLAMLLADDAPTLDPALRLGLPPIRLNRWLLAHAATIAAGYGAFAIAAAVGLLAIALGKARELAGVLPGLMLAGVGLLAIGLASGLAWARAEWAGDWSRDPKLIASMATLGIYLATLVGHRAGRLGPGALAVASVLGLASSVASWYGLNFAHHSGRHGYGFSDDWPGGAWWFGPVTLAVALAFAIGAFRRISASSPPGIGPNPHNTELPW